ncbi:cysteine--tRNA ligase [Patescibacteria group bacterium]|nr:cysteine--tRNA ligase [Patescibacteria group bacterium]
MLRFYNTLTRKKEVFTPLENKTVKIYTCGPTVYNYAHIGNLSSYLFADLLKRYLRYSDYKVLDVMNVTDVDDKTIKASQENNVSLEKYTSFFVNVFLDDCKKLNIIKPQILCKATEHIKDMISLIQKLIDKGYAYKSADGSVYYKIANFKDYGKFAGFKKEQLKIGASNMINRDEYKKEEASDFVLWKKWSEKDGDIYWDSPFNKGRPGWHIECSAMSMKYLGDTFDIHTGAIDLIFPHHQNEIAQSEGATGKQFVRFWLHRGFLKINNERMAKSLGNIYTLEDILKKVSDPLAFRYLILTNRYRLSLNFNFESLQASLNALNKLRSFIRQISGQRISNNDSKQNLQVINEYIEKARANFKNFMDNDLDTPKAIADFFHFVSKINKLMNKKMIGKKGSELILSFVNKINQVWGFLEPKEMGIDKELKDKIGYLIKIRDKYRANKEWGKADDVREKLNKMGVIIKDTKDSSAWSLHKF